MKAMRRMCFFLTGHFSMWYHKHKRERTVTKCGIVTDLFLNMKKPSSRSGSDQEAESELRK